VVHDARQFSMQLLLLSSHRHKAHPCNLLLMRMYLHI
jgi:hypothetical protein